VSPLREIGGEPGDLPGAAGADSRKTGPIADAGTGAGDKPASDRPADDKAADDKAAGDEAAGDKAAGGARARKRRRSGWRELPVLIVIALVIALVIKTFIVQAFYIPSGSMEDTLLIGDKILVNKLVYDFRGIQPGDIVVFNGAGSWTPSPPPTRPGSDPVIRAYDATVRPVLESIASLFGTPVGQTDFVKRVIGVPGDHVVCCNARGLVTVNGVPLHEQSYLYPGAAPSLLRFNITVPPGRLWVMGDNRAISEDSRLRQEMPGHGTIPENQVVGRAFVIAWPPSQWRILPIPSTFSQPGISKPVAPGDSAAAQSAPAAQRAAAELAGTRVAPESPYLPLVAGFTCAVPLTWLQRRTRRRLRGRFRAGRIRRPGDSPGQ
jgi:signal peptidase I